MTGDWLMGAAGGRAEVDADAAEADDVVVVVVDEAGVDGARAANVEDENKADDVDDDTNRGAPLVGATEPAAAGVDS